MEEVSLLKIGVNVDIQRTDGRIHSAVISGVNSDNRSVTVEWFERGETKGKEIEVDAIFQLNPELLPPTNDNQSSHNGVDYNNRIIPKETPRNVKSQGVKPSLVRLPLSSEDQSQSDVGGGGGGRNDPSPPGGDMDNLSGGDEARKNNGNSYRKKSNCVKEVEKIKQKRVERRAQQMALREQHEQDFDTSQPSWEFEAMIRSAILGI